MPTLIIKPECVIVCTSVHHGNTRKVADAMASATGALVLEASDRILGAVADGVLLGLGSGIFFGSHHKTLVEFARSLPDRAAGRAFVFSTSGTGYDLPHRAGIDYHGKVRHILRSKGYDVVGEFSCKGFDTYGPWGKFGGIARGHPTATDLEDAGEFATGVLQRTADS